MYGMMREQLLARAAEDRPVTVAFVGAGRMGTGAMCQIGCMQGMRVAIIADVDLDRARRAFELSGWKREDILTARTVGEAADAIRAGKPVVVEDAYIACDSPVEAVVDATGNVELGARIAMRTIRNGRHVIMLNVETDVVVGPILYDMARQAGVVYTVSSGDEPGLIAEYIDRYESLGLEIVAVGKTPTSIANLDVYATPDSVGEEAKRLGVNPHFLVTFRDATKTMIEMAAISNYSGLVPDIPGMHGPVAGIKELPKMFRLKEKGGLLNRHGVIDYARPLLLPDGEIDLVNSVTPGVFLVVYVEHEQIREDFGYFTVTGSDGYYNLYTPYHLVTTEIPLSIGTAVFFNRPTVVAKRGLVTEVTAVAKRDLKAGEKVSGAGGAEVYSSNDLYRNAKAANQVPLNLLPGATMKRDVARDAVLTYDDVDLLTDTTLYHLRRLQDQMTF